MTADIQPYRDKSHQNRRAKMSIETATFIEQVQFVRSMLNEDFDWEAHDYPDFGDEFRNLIETDLSNLKYEDYISCGSFDPESTTDELYRLLWLVQPKQVDFSDMYKTRLFEFASKDLKCIVTVELFKYELALYYYALRPLVDASKASPVWVGHPSGDNGVKSTDETVNAFLDLVQVAVKSTHLVYGGNNFEV
jgi:hypothetical protein